MTDPAGAPLSGSIAAGQVTRILASEVVCVGGVIYVIFALKTASAGTLFGWVTVPVGFASFVKYIVSGVATFRQWPFKLDQSQGSFGSGGSGQAFEACPGGSRTSARRKEEICDMIWLAVVW